MPVGPTRLNSDIAAMLNALSSLRDQFRNLSWYVLVITYVLVYYSGIEIFIHTPLGYYIFTVFLCLAGIYFAWLIGGRQTMFFVAFFNIFFVFVFSKLLLDLGIITSARLFLTPSFLGIYALSLVFLLLILIKKSPADQHREKQLQAMEIEKQSRQNLEFMIASNKLKHELVTQANLVKDELQLLEGTWRSNIHDILNDLQPAKEREIYNQIILPFQQNIIEHLRRLEDQLTFDLQHLSLPDLADEIVERIEDHNLKKTFGLQIDLRDQGWRQSSRSVPLDPNKLWDMLRNVLRNSQAALDFRWLQSLRDKQAEAFAPAIRMTLSLDLGSAWITVTDNGGGVSEETAEMMFKKPVLSRKRKGKTHGQGTLFVKFFADRMNIRAQARNTRELGSQGLQVTFELPLDPPGPEERAWAAPGLDR